MTWRILTGLIPGFLLAAALSGWWSWLQPGIWSADLAMALLWFFPVWVTIIVFCLIAERPGRLCLRVSLAAACGLGALWLAQVSGLIL